MLGKRATRGFPEVSRKSPEPSTTQPAAVVPGAQVVISNPSRGIHLVLTASDGGVFDAPSLAPASGYEVTVNKAGFAEYAVKDIDLPVGRNVGLTVTLAVGTTVTQVNVESVAPLVDDTKTDVSQVVNSREIIDLPINGRRVDTFVLLTPGVTNDGNYGLLTFRGVANGNTFLVDGNDTTDQFWVENAGRTRTVSQLSQDAVQEFEVVSSNFSAPARAPSPITRSSGRAASARPRSSRSWRRCTAGGAAQDRGCSTTTTAWRPASRCGSSAKSLAYPSSPRRRRPRWRARPKRAKTWSSCSSIHPRGSARRRRS